MRDRRGRVDKGKGRVDRVDIVDKVDKGPRGSETGNWRI